MNLQRSFSRYTKLSSAAVLIAGVMMLPGSVLATDAPHGSGSVSVSGATLLLTGTEYNDRVFVSDISGDRVQVTINGKNHRFPAANISDIQFVGNEGNDVFINYSEASAVAFGNEGNDYLKTHGGPAMFYGGTGNDHLLGSHFDDYLCGGSDDDVIFGFDGNDVIAGDATDSVGGGGGGGATDVDAVILGDSAFARGMFVQVGVNDKGTFGTDNSTVPAGFVDLRADGRGGLFGFIADSGRDGYEMGGYDGDFFTPGTPEEGFGVQIDGTNYNNNNAGNIEQIPGMITSASVGTSGDIDWVGDVGGLEVARKISVFEQGLFIRIEATLTNRSGGALNDIYYLNNVDPDNDQSIHGNFSTFNMIISQGDEAADNLSLVTAQQTATGPGMSGGTEATGSALSLVSFDPRGRVTFGGFSNRNAEDVYTASASLEGTVGATETADIAISLAFDVGTLASGESTTLVYYYSLDPTGIDTTGITDNENACADDGLTGDDFVDGGNGDDDITTDAGEDIVYGGQGNDNIDSGFDADYVYGQNGNDQILSGRGDDRVFGGPGDDVINSSRGADHVYGESGDDEIRAGTGDDKVFGGNGVDFINLEAGNDRAYGQGGDDTILGGNGADFIDGGADDDYLVGHADSDEIFGGPGDDRLLGGTGVDQLNGGSGNDRVNQ